MTVLVELSEIDLIHLRMLLVNRRQEHFMISPQSKFHVDEHNKDLLNRLRSASELLREIKSLKEEK